MLNANKVNVHKMRIFKNRITLDFRSILLSKLSFLFITSRILKKNITNNSIGDTNIQIESSIKLKFIYPKFFNSPKTKYKFTKVRAIKNILKDFIIIDQFS